MIQKYKATIPLSKNFFRNYELKGNMSLFALHEFLCSEFAFSPDQMILFQGLSPKGNVVHEYGLFDMGDGSIDGVTIRDTLSRGETVIRYIYNLSKNLYLDLSWEEEAEDERQMAYPRLAGGKGDNPQQFSASYHEDAVNDVTPVPHADLPDDEDDEDDEDDGEDDDTEDVFDEDELPEGVDG